MQLDIWGAIRRAVTLPAAHNSLEDALGKDAANVVSHLVHDSIGSAVSNALAGAIMSGLSGVDHVVGHVQDEVSRVLGGLPPALAPRINNSIREAVGNAETIAITQVAALTEKIVSGIGGVLKVS